MVLHRLWNLNSIRCRHVPSLIFALITAVLTGFGRIISEVGASMMVGGNIMGFTRNITTAIALETSKGNLTLALALGAVLLTLSLLVNALVIGIREYAAKRQYA